MYETLFGMESRPFSPAPILDAYFPSAAAQAARNEVGRCLERAEGPALLIGGPGLGKSLMCRVLADDLRNRLDPIVLNSAGLCTRRALLQSILAGLRLEFQGLDEGDLRMALVDHLERPSGMARPLALLVDESHALPQRLLEELRLLSNVIYQGEPRIRIALVGSQRMEERLANPKLESFQQRVASRSFLQPFTRQETAAYLRREVERCGGRFDRAFAESAIEAIHKATDGIPRLINQVCDHALILQAVAGDEPVNARAIEESWADLQRLPAPWHESRPEAATVIEFGELPGDDLSTNSIDRLASESVGVSAGFSGSRDEAALEFDAIVATNSAPEAEFVFQATDLLSGEGFVDEEPVADRYAALAAEASLARAQDAVERIVEFPAAASPNPLGRAREESMAIWTNADSPSPIARPAKPYAEVAKFDPALDPVFPDSTAPPPAPKAVDAIVEIDAPPAVTRPPKSPRFRRLFSSVLKG